MDTIESDIKDLSLKINGNIDCSNTRGILKSIYHSSKEFKAVKELICFAFGTTAIPEFIYPLMQLYSYQYPYIKQYLDLYLSKPNQG